MAEPSTKKRKTAIAQQRKEEPKINDPRFSNIQSDPRYRLPGKRERFRVDKRFSRALQDEDFSRRAKVDRYGRQIHSESERQRLKRKYHFEEEEDDEESDEPDDDEEVQEELTRIAKTHDPLREGRDADSSSDDSSSEDESEDEIDEDEEQIPDAQQRDVPLGEVTYRLAVVNIDWDNIRAQDLMAVFSSPKFLPANGRLLKVAVYPSEFGKERLEHEEMNGPPREIFAQSKSDDRDISSDQDSGDEEIDEDDIKESLVKPDDGSEFNSSALRRYQLERLRYFYAVLIFSSPEAAKAMYDAIDGTEYLSSANFFDLRFIPDETDFSSDQARDVCESIPSGYKPNEFITDALQHSRVRLTWDADDGGRKEAAARAFRGGRKEIDENDLKAYLGTDTSSDDEDDDGENDGAAENSNKSSTKEKERQKMRQLLGLPAEEVKPSKKDGPVGNVQITFSAGLSGDTNVEGVKRSVFENSPEPEETTAEKYIRKERERKARRKEKWKAAKYGQSETDVLDGEPTKLDTTTQQDDLGFDDPFFAEPDPNAHVAAKKIRKEERMKKKQEREAEEQAERKQRAELELLMADENGADSGVRHFDMRDIQKQEKNAAKKHKKKGGNKQHLSEVANEDTFKVDAADPRFSQLFESHEYAIDPTNPRFSGTKGMKALLEEGRKRRDKGGKKTLAHNIEGSRSSGVSTGSRNSGDVKSLVQKIKGKKLA